MMRGITLKFERRPAERSIVWIHEYEGRDFPAKVRPGYIISAKCNGSLVYLEVLDAGMCGQGVTARMVDVYDAEEELLHAVYRAGHTIKLDESHIFSCEIPVHHSSRQRANTVLIQTQLLRIHGIN